jgi:hypothetical protein
MVEGGRPAMQAGFPADTLFPERVQRGDHVMWLAVVGVCIKGGSQHQWGVGQGQGRSSVG